jgi:TP901 family phage tail tape measure protein
MPSARDIKAGSAYVVIGAIDKTAAVLKRVAAKFKSVGDAINSIGIKTLAVGGTLTAPFIAATKVFADMGDEINKSSQRTGVAVEELSALKYAADQSGSSLDDLETSLKHLSKTVTAAGQGDKTALQTLLKLGVGYDELKGKLPDEQFKVVADRLSKVQDATTKAAFAQELFGKSGTQLLPLLADGAAGIQSLEDRARELGLTFSKDDAEAATKFGDIMTDLWKQFKQVNFVVGEAIAKFLQPYAEAATRVMKSVIDWTKQNQALVLTVAAVGVGLLAAGAAIIALGATISGLGTVLGTVATGLTAISAVLGAMISPIGLVVAGLAGLGVVFATTTETGRKAISGLADLFYQLRDIAKDAFGGIADALAAGDIQLAAQVLWTGLKLAWAVGTEALLKKWIDFKTSFIQVAIAAFYGAADIWTNVVAIFKSSIEDLKAFFSEFGAHAVMVFKDLKTLGSNAAPEEKDKQIASHQQDAAAATAQREAERAQRKADIEAERAAAVKQNAESEAAISAGASASADQEAAALQAQIADLKKQLEEQKGQAHNERLGVTPAPDVKKIQDATEGVARKLSSSGTFNAGAVAGLIGSDVGNQIADNTKRAADKLDLIARKFPVAVVS